MEVTEKPQILPQSETFVLYFFEIAADTILGLLLGLIVNEITNYLAKTYNLGLYPKIYIQFLLICTVLYLIKGESSILYKAWQGESYGIIFIAAFLSIQKNVLVFFTHIYDEIS